MEKINTRTSSIIGAILVILGSFLPWEQAGDFISYWTAGIEIHWRAINRLEDNGGLLVIILGLAVIGLLVYQPHFIKNSALWVLILGATLSIVSIYHVVGWLIRRIQVGGVIGAPILQFGLVIVVIGSLLVFVSGLLDYRRQSVRASNY